MKTYQVKFKSEMYGWEFYSYQIIHASGKELAEKKAVDLARLFYGQEKGDWSITDKAYWHKNHTIKVSVMRVMEASPEEVNVLTKFE